MGGPSALVTAAGPGTTKSLADGLVRYLLTYSVLLTLEYIAPKHLCFSLQVSPDLGKSNSKFQLIFGFTVANIH